MRLMLGILLFCISGLVSAEPSADLVRVFKSERKLQILSSGIVLYEFQIALGSNPKGQKIQEGDGRTPEGTYILDYKKPDSAFYKAIHISYPDVNDIASAKARGVNPGGQIMIHGQKNGLGWLSFISQRFDWTNGCVALSNADMEILWSIVKQGTKVEIHS
jgi:murein L,D-transpeptidase YafK